MSQTKPPPSSVWKAIETYLSIAYSTIRPPTAVQSRLQTLHLYPETEFYACEVFEKTPADAPTRWSLRLGNEFYPHMKLVIERRPDSSDYLFRADTHDRHACPPKGSRDYPAFCQLMERNQDIAQKVEAAWADSGTPTFKTFLREDLSRRKSVGDG